MFAWNAPLDGSRLSMFLRASLRIVESELKADVPIEHQLTFLMVIAGPGSCQPENAPVDRESWKTRPKLMVVVSGRATTVQLFRAIFRNLIL